MIATQGTQHGAHPEWESVLTNLRRRHPGASDGILFCVYKLQQNPAATLRDFRDEARLHGLSVAGRSLHSARQILGLGKRAPANGDATSEPRSTRSPKSEDESIEDRVIDAVRRIQESATAQSRRLREAMQEAVRILQRALDE